MKKFTYLLATAALLAACSGNQGYTVKGSVEGAADGDTVYMQAREGRQLIKLDSAVITNGEFQFKGTKAGRCTLPDLQIWRKQLGYGLLLRKRKYPDPFVDK